MKKRLTDITSEYPILQDGSFLARYPQSPRIAGLLDSTFALLHRYNTPFFRMNELGVTNTGEYLARLQECDPVVVEHYTRAQARLSE